MHLLLVVFGSLCNIKNDMINRDENKFRFFILNKMQ